MAGHRYNEALVALGSACASDPLIGQPLYPNWAQLSIQTQAGVVAVGEGRTIDGRSHIVSITELRWMRECCRRSARNAAGGGPTGQTHGASMDPRASSRHGRLFAGRRGQGSVGRCLEFPQPHPTAHPSFALCLVLDQDLEVWLEKTTTFKANQLPHRFTFRVTTAGIRGPRHELAVHPARKPQLPRDVDYALVSAPRIPHNWSLGGTHCLRLHPLYLPLGSIRSTCGRRQSQRQDAPTSPESH